jgi:hypothetical protein
MLSQRVFASWSGWLRGLVLLLPAIACVEAAYCAPPLTASVTLTVTAGGAAATSVAAKTVVTLTATVTTNGNPAAVSPGQVVFCDGSSPTVVCTDIHRVGLAQLNAAGTATMKLVPGTGSHTYRAVFLGTHCVPSTNAKCIAVSPSSYQALTVLAPTAPVKTTVGIQGGGGAGYGYTLLGTVASNGQNPPTGPISFLDTNNNYYNLGTATLGPTGADSITFLSAFNYATPISPYLLGSDQYSSEYFQGDNVVTADLNGDGIPDLLIANGGNNSIIVLLGNGDGTFTTSQIPNPSGFTPGYVAVGDFNSDGKMDFAVTNNIQEGSVIYLGNGDGTFTAGQVLTTTYSGVLTSLQSADLNGDGIPDLVGAASEMTPEQSYLQVYLGNGDGTFTAVSPRTSLLPGQGDVITMVVADFNGDGVPDVATTWFGVTVMLGNGDGTFTAAPVPAINSLSTGPILSGIAAADLNQDGKMDLVADSIVPPNTFPPPAPPPTALVLLGNGDGTFTTLAADLNLSKYSDSVAIADFNNDGKPDLVMPDINGGTSNVYFGRGDGTFIPDAFSPSLADYVGYSPVAADFNGDGLTDIALLYLDEYGFDTPPNHHLGVELGQSAGTTAGYIYNVSPVGTGYHYVDANYTGDANNMGGVSTPLGLVAMKVTTKLGVGANPTSAYASQPVTLTATLSQYFAQNHSASGNVTFTDQTTGTSLGTAPVVNGIATLTVTALPVGSNVVGASYPGDTNFTGSSATGRSGVDVMVVPAPPGFTLQLQPASLTLGSGQPGASQLLLTSVNGYVGTLTLSNGPLPQFATAGFSSASVTLAPNGTGISSFTLNTALKSSNRRPVTGFFAAAVVLLLLPRRKKMATLLALLLTAFAMQATTGCTSNEYAVQDVPAGNYPIVVTATDTNGNARTATLNVVVTQ